MEIHDPSYVSARREQMYGYPSTLSIRADGAVVSHAIEEAPAWSHQVEPYINTNTLTPLSYQAAAMPNSAAFQAAHLPSTSLYGEAGQVVITPDGRISTLSPQGLIDPQISLLTTIRDRIAESNLVTASGPITVSASGLMNESAIAPGTVGSFALSARVHEIGHYDLDYRNRLLVVGPQPSDSFVGHLAKPDDLYVYAHVSVSDFWRDVELKAHRVFSVFIDGALKVFGNVLAAILIAEKVRAKLALRELIKRRVKTLRKLFRLFPHSLRPIESIAH
jgi:hypothetical protein